MAEQSLAKAGLIDAVRFIVSVSDGLPPKPSPEIFAKAARRLDCPPRLALVVEDSKQGVQAARSAGMDVLKINL